MFLIPWCASISKLDLLGFWSMIDFLFEGWILLRLVCKSSRLGLIIYFCKKGQKKFKL
jgi:NADH:ubiquinone oxidoreductase subunit 3 (subunit A)